MTFARGSIIVLIVITGVTGSLQGLDLPEQLGSSVGEADLGYRPWDHDDAATTWISLSGMRIGALSSTFTLNIPNLRWLVMDDNEIQNVPSRAFRSFPDLTYISLARNGISDFETEAFDRLESLEVLDMDLNPVGNSFDSDILVPLIRLKRLYLRNCRISSFTLPIKMDHLSHLYLSGNQLDVFYTDYESSLQYLHLDANQLRFVSLSNFESLIYANLSNNQLTRIVRRSEVPPDYHARTIRERGYYRHTNYGVLDDSGLYLDDASAALKDLIISFNQISEIESDTFRDTKSLNNVDLRNNEIREVYAGTFNNMLKLESILLDSNKIKQINHRAFDNLPNLKTISLTNNQIDDLDEDAFTKLNSSANEVYLFLDYNRIHTLRRGSFRDIEGLKHIGLSNNRIKTISSEAFVNLPNLESIVIEYQSRDESVDPSPWELQGTIGGPLERRGSIESDAFFNLSNLISIIIRGNLFTRIEAQAFHELPKLTTLDLSNNSISTLSAKAFSDLPTVENLYLDGNSISAIAPDTFPKQLKYLNLASNLVCPEFSCWHIVELRQLQQLDVSGIIERFTIDDLTGLSKNLTVIVGKAGTMSSLPCPYY